MATASYRTEALGEGRPVVAVPTQRMSDDPRPFAGVTIETHVVGRMRTVASVGEAAEVLLHDWPETGKGKPISARFTPVTRRSKANSTSRTHAMLSSPPRRRPGFS